MEPIHFIDAQRIQTSILTPLEKQGLIWIARRLPAWMSPDFLTCIGFLAMILSGGAYILSNQWPIFLLVVNVFIFLNWFGDSLDGTVARVRNQLRPRYGFYVDHIVDMFGALFLITGLAGSHYISIVPAAATLISFLMLSIHSFLVTYVQGVFKLSAGKFGPTELRILLIFCNIFVFFNPSVILWGKERLTFDILGTMAAIAMGSVLIFSVIQSTVQLYNTEKVDIHD